MLSQKAPPASEFGHSSLPILGDLPATSAGRNGEGGIRTPERGHPRYAISSRARSAAPAPLHACADGALEGYSAGAADGAGALSPVTRAPTRQYSALAVRALFFNEGNLDTHVLGHAQLDAALHVGLSTSAEVEGRFAGLSELTGRSQLLASRRIRLLRKADLDLVVLRWQLVQSARARRLLTQELARWPADVVHLYTPAVAFALADVMRRTPVVLSTGATVHEWWLMPAWGPT
jgi:hypothetical protein